MQTQTDIKQPTLDLEYLPSFAQYLLTHQLESLVRLQRQLALEEDLPLLRQVAHLDSDTQLDLLRSFAQEQLTYLAENRAAEWIEVSIRHWLQNDFPFDRYTLLSEDISKTAYIRKKSFMQFLQGYCVEGAQMLQVIEDIDRFHLHHSKAVMNVFARLMEERLQSREAQLLEAQSIAHIGSYLWDLETGRSTVTPELTRLLEVENDNTGFLAHVHEDDRARVEAELTAARRSGRFESEFRYQHSTGLKYLWSRGKVRYRDNKPVSIAGTVMDVTDRHQLLQQMQEKEHFIQQIADASPMVLYLFDIPSGCFHYLNREIFYVLGYTPEEVLAMTPEQVGSLYHPEDRHLLPERSGSDSHFQYHESMMQYECRLRKKDGSWYWLLAREIVFRKDEQGNILQILGAALDINRRKEMERTLLQNSFQLEQSNASLEEFAYVASHDLKEPLRKISTFGDRLVASQMDRMSEDGKIYLKKVVDASQRMQAMIDDLLSVSRISGNRSFENTSLQSLLSDALQTLEFKIEQKGVTVDVPEPLPEAKVVPSQFRQLFQNLLSNSIKFAQENVAPVIRIRYSVLRPDEVPAGVSKAASYLALEFTDNGIGFEQEFAGKIFQIFQRLHGRSEYEGNGIGLAIVKKIAEHHGGTIYASGTPGEGAVFTLILPL